MPEITDLSDEELKKLYESTTPSPGIVEGTARAVSQGMVGAPNQPKDTAFANEHSVYSGGGGMLGRAADVVLPMLGGRMAGRVLANRMRPTVNPRVMAADAELNAVNQYGVVHPRTGKIELDALARPRVDRAVAMAEDQAERLNKSAARWKQGLQFGGGVTGGAIGGATGAALRGEDPQTGALIGGATGLTPAAGSVLPRPGNLALGLGAGAIGWGLDKAGVPIIPQALKDFSLGKFLNIAEGKKK